jgi:hypothetical protein
MHKIKQTIFITPDEVKEYELSPKMVGNPIYITEEDKFLVPHYGSELYYEVTENKREILAIRDLVGKRTSPPPPPPEREVRKTFLSW